MLENVYGHQKSIIRILIIINQEIVHCIFTYFLMGNMSFNLDLKSSISCPCRYNPMTGYFELFFIFQIFLFPTTFASFQCKSHCPTSKIRVFPTTSASSQFESHCPTSNFQSFRLHSLLPNANRTVQL